MLIFALKTAFPPKIRAGQYNRQKFLFYTIYAIRITQYEKRAYTESIGTGPEN